MVSPGRKPTPVADKILAGNPGKRRLTRPIPDPPEGPLEVPEEVREDPVALYWWRHYERNFRHLKPGDEPMLMDLCLSRSILKRNRAQMAKGGEVVRAPNTGLPIQSPWLSIVNKQVDLSRKLAAELGFPPSERNRIGQAEPDDNDPTAVYFNA